MQEGPCGMKKSRPDGGRQIKLISNFGRSGAFQNVEAKPIRQKANCRHQSGSRSTYDPDMGSHTDEATRREKIDRAQTEAAMARRFNGGTRIRGPKT